jgi:hypothetical protein
MKYKVAKSKIPNADKGLFAKNKLDRGERIGLAHRDGQPVGTIGNMHNHSDNPNMRSIKVGNERYVYAIKDIEPGEELTTDYRMQPELEQPEDFMRKGGRTRGLVAMPKPSKKGLASKKYSRSLSATNRLFAVNPLFKKPKSRKNKIFDPNAKYYQDGGGKGDSPFKIKPNLYTFSQGPDSQVIGGRLDMSHKSGLHGNITAETPFMNKRIQPSSAQNIGFRKKYKNLYGDATLSNFATPGKLINPSADVELGYERDLGKGFNANIGLRNTMTPGSYYNPSLSAGIKYGFEDGGFIETELTPEEIEQYRKGGYIIEEVNDPSVPTLNRFTNGGGPGDDLEKNLQEVTIYDPKTKKEQLKLFEQLRVAKEAYQNYTKQNKGKKWKLNAADPLGSSISDLKKQIQLYRDEFKKEKEETERELKRLESLKNKGVFKNNKDIQNLKLKDLDTTKGRMKILDAIRSSNLSGDEVAAIYKGYGLDVVDSNVKRGTGPNKDYSAIETKAAAMKDVPQFVDMVSNVATAIPLIGAAGAVGGAAGSVLNNPYVQGAGTAYAAGQVAAHPIDTATGIATTGVEVYDKLMGDEDNINRFGDEYWQDLDHLANLAIVAHPGLKTMKAARDWIKTSKAGFNFARKYIKPAKDFYKSGVRKFAKVADPLLKTNVPMAVSKPVAAVIDAATGSNKATAVVDKVGKALESMPTWAQPNVTNALRGYTLSVAAERGVEGAQEVQEGFSSGDKETFEKGIDNVVNAAVSIGSVTPAYHANNIITPLTVMSSAENVIDDASQGELSLETGFNLARLINAMAGLPTTRSQVVPIDTKGFKGFNYLKPRHIRRHLRDDVAIPQQQKGGIVTTMSKAEIDDYIKRGYIVEELD